MADADTEPKGEGPLQLLGPDRGPLFLSLIGLWLVVGCFFPALSGVAWLEEALGPGKLEKLLIGFLFLYFSAIVREKTRLRRTLDGIVTVIRTHLSRAGAKNGGPAADRGPSRPEPRPGQ